MIMTGIIERRFTVRISLLGLWLGSSAQSSSFYRDGDARGVEV
jgi:hypothetical protein